MKTLVDIALVSRPSACVTSLELLEDFADSAPGWFFLEDESRHLTGLRRLPVAVLRTRRRGVIADLVFVARSADAPHCLRLRLIEADDDRTTLDGSQRREIAHHFAVAFGRYLEGRAHLAALETVEAGEEAYAA